MAKYLGIDPGTRSFDFCGIGDDAEQILFEKSIPSERIADNPSSFIDMVSSQKFDCIIGPSGYGLPIKRLDKLAPEDMFLLTLVKGTELDDIAVLSGMQSALQKLSAESIPMYFIPGVIHLPTVPRYRKLNKVDMGTADKLCCAALGIWSQSLGQATSYDKVSFLLLEVGFGYTSAIAVSNGKIVDGIGGTGGAPGFVSLGSMDSELAYLLEKFKKSSIFTGGSYSAESEKPNLALLEKDGAARKCLIESAMKNLLAISASVPSQNKKVLISGRLTRIPGIAEELMKELTARGFEPSPLKGFATNSKEAAQGAALIANGLSGGKYKELVDILELKKAKGTCLDYLTLSEHVKERYGLA